MENQVIDIYATRDLTEDIVNLAGKHGVEISTFLTVGPAMPPNNFPNLDPTLITALQQAVVIIGTGTTAVHFVKELLELVRSANGKAHAVDRKTRRPLKAS